MKLGGYPRLWFGDGGHLDLLEPVAPEASEAFERRWAEAHVLVEWMVSPKGRLDRLLPQSLPRLAHNANVRSARKHETGPY